MRGHFNYRFAAMISIVALTAGFYIYNLLPHNNKFEYTFNTSLTEQETGSSAQSPDSTAGGNTSDADTPVITPVPSTALSPEPQRNWDGITVRGVTFYLGESKDSLIKKLGLPGRIDETEYDFDFYIYNNDYNRLLFVAVREDQVAGFYTDSTDFNFKGICSGSDINAVGKALHKTFTMADILTQENAEYSIQVFMDQLDTKKVTGIYVLPKDAVVDEYTDQAMRNIEQMIYDLTNSIRMRNQVPALSWSSSASLSSRKHSLDMAANNFFSHINLKRESYVDRMRAEGIYFKRSCENIIAGYGTAILSVNKLFNSKTQRKNMLNPDYRYLGAGFAYSADSTYHTYITQNFYR